MLRIEYILYLGAVFCFVLWGGVVCCLFEAGLYVVLAVLDLTLYRLALNLQRSTFLCLLELKVHAL